MKKILLAFALVASPVFAQESAKETTQEINYYARDFPQWAERDKGSAVERSYNRSIAASDNYAKVRAQRKETVPVVRVEGTIVVQVQVDDGRYRPRCPYNNCR